MFFLQIQGSGRVKLSDGKILRLSFAARNGRPYTSIGRVLVESDFPEVFVKRGPYFDLWALALMPAADKTSVLTRLRANDLDLFPDSL